MKTVSSIFRLKEISRCTLLACGIGLTSGLVVNVAYAQQAAEASAKSSGGTVEEIVATPKAPQTKNDGTRLETIVVTSRKRSESIDVVPLSISAMASEKIEMRNLKTIEDVASFTPGFYTQSQTGTGTGRNDRSFRQLTFRAVGANTTNVGPMAGGVAFLDGSPVLNSSLSNIQDLERVEVLRGPQGVYFGRSTFIGAVNYITKEPTQKWTGTLTTEVGQSDLVDTSLSASGAVIPDVLSLRLSGRHFAKGGQYFTSNEHTRVGDQGTDSMSLTVLFKPIPDLRIRAFYNQFKDNDGPPAQYTLGGKSATGGSNCNLGGTYGPYYCGEVPQKADPSRISANLQMSAGIYDNMLAGNRPAPIPVPFDFSSIQDNFGLRRDANQFSTKIEYRTQSDITLTSVSAYHDEKIVTLADLSFVATPNQYTAAVGYKARDWSQELRATSAATEALRWTAGFNYIALNNSTSGIPGQFPPFGFLNFGPAQVGYTASETPAAFVGLYYDVLPKLTLTGEGRYQRDTLIGHYWGLATAARPAGYVDVRKTFASFSPRVSLEYKLAPTQIVYALASKGTKPGGFNQGILTQPQFILDQVASAGAAAVYDEEKLTNYELGIKGSFFDNRVRLALNGYLGKYTNAQVPIPVQYYTTQNANGTPNTAGPINSFGLTRNIGKVDLKGLELEGEAIVLPGWRVGATLAYTGSEIKAYGCSECGNIIAQNPNYNAATGANNIQSTSTVGKRLSGTPKVTYTLSSNYEREVIDGVIGYIGGDYIYRGSYFAEAANIASSGASKIFNLRIGARKGNSSLELFARNLFDNRSPSIAYATFDAASAGVSGNMLRIGLPEARRLGIRASVTF